MTAPALLIDDLDVRRGAATVVRSASLAAPDGVVTALVGPNGAGKSSLVESCVGLLSSWTGRIAVAGRSRTAGGAPTREERERVGVMLQDGGLSPGARPLELVRHVARLHADPLDAAGLLDRLGIDPTTRTTIRRLSGGEQQRVKCALALVGRPRLVFLDEPTAGLDATGRAAFRELVAELVADGVAVVLATHLMEDVERLAGRVVVIGSGSVVASGTLTELAGDPDSIRFRAEAAVDLASLRARLPAAVEVAEVAPGRYVASRAADPMVLSSVAAWCAEHGGTTADIVVGRRPLDDVVLDLVGRS